MIVDNEKVVCFDIDSTLVKTNTDGELELSLYGLPKKFKVFRGNVEQIHTHIARGWFVIVWSNNGPGWASTVLTGLGIDPNSDKVLVINKPGKIFDDEDASVWMPKRVHLHEDEL